ncbi:MAG: hypothetical protein ACI3ZT_02505, partial [Candidatus Cryptobacteroides sp.]
RNISYADSGKLDLIEDDRRLKYDPVEWTARWEEIIDEADRIAEERLADQPRGMGYCHAFWSERAAALASLGLEWRSPVRMNPGVLFD